MVDICHQFHILYMMPSINRRWVFYIIKSQSKNKIKINAYNKPSKREWNTSHLLWFCWINAHVVTRFCIQLSSCMYVFMYVCMYVTNNIICTLLTNAIYNDLNIPILRGFNLREQMCLEFKRSWKKFNVKLYACNL